jgi:hypothetical protein
VSRLALGILLLLLSAAAWGTPSVSRFQIANGLQIIVERVPNAPLTAIEVWVRAGVAHETAETSGVAHLLEHLLFRGAVGSPPDALDSAFEHAGGILDASTERDWTRFRASVLPDRWREPLQTLLRSLLNPTLPADALEKERRLILHDEYALHYADPIRPARYALFAERFPNHPYGLPLLGDPDTLARLSVEAVRQFHQAHYRPDRMVVVVVGAVEPDAVRRAAEEVFTSLVGTESLRQGQFSPAHAWGQARFFALTPRAPLSRLAGEGEGAPPCAPTPLSHAVGEGSGVRATESKEAVRGSVSSGVLALALPTPPAQDIDGWLCAEVLRVALAEPYRGLLYAGEPPFGRLQSEYLPRLQGSILAFYALPPVRGGDDWQSQTRQRLERALQQIVAGEQRAALEEARAIALARHTATMRNLLERAPLVWVVRRAEPPAFARSVRCTPACAAF